MSGTATTSSVGLHCCHWTRVPALGTPNADSGALAHLVGLDRLMKKCMSSPVQLMSCQVGWYLGSNLRFLRVNSLTLKKPKMPRVKAALSIRRSCLFRGGCLQPLQHVTQHLHSQRQSCGLEVDGRLEALDIPCGKLQHWVTGRGALVPHGVVQE